MIIRGLMRGMTTLPQGNKELLVVRQSWKTPGEFGVSKSMECCDTVGWTKERASGL